MLTLSADRRNQPAIGNPNRTVEGSQGFAIKNTTRISENPYQTGWRFFSANLGKRSEA